MLSTIIIILSSFTFFIGMIILSESYTKFWKTIAGTIMVLSTFILISAITITFTGIHIKNSTGQYTGYVTAIQKTGTIFKGYTVYLKTDLESSQEDTACVDRNKPELIEKLKQIQERKKDVNLTYESVWQYAIGECPKSDWMITGIN